MSWESILEVFSRPQVEHAEGRIWLSDDDAPTRKRRRALYEVLLLLAVSGAAVYYHVTTPAVLLVLGFVIVTTGYQLLRAPGEWPSLSGTKRRLYIHTNDNEFGVVWRKVLRVTMQRDMHWVVIMRDGEQEAIQFHARKGAPQWMRSRIRKAATNAEE